MPRNVPVDLATHLAGATLNLAWCWDVTRADSTAYYYTTHDEDLIISGHTYKSAISFLPTSLDVKSGLNVDNAEATIFMDATDVTEADLESGVFDNAEVNYFRVNWADLTDGIEYLAKGWTIGEIEIGEYYAKFELRSKTQRLQQKIHKIITPYCRNIFGVNDPPHSRCPVSVASSYTYSGTVTGVTSRSVFADSARGETADVFRRGIVTFTSGDNNGYSREVDSFNPSSDEFTLFLPMPYSIATSDTYQVTYGCDKKYSTCKSSYSAQANFGGFPHVPDTDKALQYKIKV